MKTVRFFIFDARAGFFVVLVIIHARLWTLLLALTVMSIFWLFERKSLTFPSALDLIESPTWISAEKTGSGLYGRRRIADFLQRPPFELYDLQRDPDEVVNLADDPASQAVKAELMARLKSFQASTRDPWLHKWTYQ